MGRATGETTGHGLRDDEDSDNDDDDEVLTLGDDDEDDQHGDLMPHQSWRQWKLASKVLVFPREPPRQSPGRGTT